MFKQVKKARELQGNEPYKNDEFNILQFILIIIFFIMIA